MRLFFCVNFFIYFALFAGLETISGFSIENYFYESNENDDYDDDYEYPEINGGITLEVRTDKSNQLKTNSESKKMKKQMHDQPAEEDSDCIQSFLQNVVDIFKLLDFLGDSEEEDDPQDEVSLTTLSPVVKTTSHKTAENISTTKASQVTTAKIPEVSSTTANSVNDVTTAIPQNGTTPDKKKL
ncbi:uncharacterized protein [Venturia canescens]|uniref:uncharacterized protein n=1 Tax=Venturia canescens TaxID=32260 RepID=UPI001C9D1878|nr:uncharacterized protein LOC122414003 [Venturia canescens]